MALRICISKLQLLRRHVCSLSGALRPNVGHRNLSSTSSSDVPSDEASQDKGSARSERQREILRAKTPIGKLDEFEGKHPYQEKEPLPEWPDGINPHTGERGGPRGPEPTRYGDWERKGKVSDF